MRAAVLCSNEELAAIFTEWNNNELRSFLIEITSIILAKKDDKGAGFLVDKIVDKTGAKGTGRGGEGTKVTGRGMVLVGPKGTGKGGMEGHRHS